MTGLEVVLPALLPALGDGVRALFQKFTGGAGAKPANVGEVIQLMQADTDRLKAIAAMEQGGQVTLGQRQRLFARLIAEHVLWLYEQGYEVTEGDSYRDPRLHGDFGVKKGYGAARSFHKIRLAKDLNLFKDSEYLATTEAHRLSGEKWKSRHPLCTWGGDFKSPDGNHYSLGEGR